MPAKFQASRFNNIKKNRKVGRPPQVFCTVYFLRLKAENTAVS